MKGAGAVCVTVPCTMIIFDPDLDADRSPSRKPARSAAIALRAHSTSNRIPSARTLERFLCQARVAVKLRGQVSVLLTTDREIRRLNRKFRGKNKATDVLSFPTAEPPKVSKSRAVDKLRAGSGAPEIAGDLAISVDTARRQAAGIGHSVSVEIKVLILHGLLHLAGYDHETDDGEMARREGSLRKRLGLRQGLIERSVDS